MIIDRTHPVWDMGPHGACFYCSTSVGTTDPHILWIGTPESIVLHPHCAAELGVHLINASREAERAGAPLQDVRCSPYRWARGRA